MLFKDRFEAGEKLCTKLAAITDAVVLAIPRGGVEVAWPVAAKLQVPLGVIAARKLTSPGNPETAFGAITPDGAVVINQEYADILGLTVKDVDAIKKETLEEAKRRQKVYSTGNAEIKRKNVVIVDDGLATGYTMLAAIKSAKKGRPEKIIVAVPVSSSGAYEMVKKECNETVCLHVSEGMSFAVGSFYSQFHQLTDGEVILMLQKANER